MTSSEVYRTLDEALASGAGLADPFPLYHRLREEEPVQWSQILHGWIVTRYADVTAGFHDDRLSSDRISQLGMQMQAMGIEPSILTDYARAFGGSMVMKDPPEHTRLRRTARGGFMQGAIDSWRPLIQQVADEIVEGVAGAARMDIVAELGRPLSLGVMSALFGIEQGFRARFQRWSEDLADFFGGTFGDVNEAARAANEGARALNTHFKWLVEARRSAPGDDLVSLILRDAEEGQIDVDVLCSQCVTILAAGHVTTVDQSSNSLHALLSHRDELEKVRQDPSLIPSAIRETLRFDPAGPFVHRVATTDLEIAGQPIQKGQLVFLGMAAANRDPREFPDPDRFDVTRQVNRHVTFGQGPHACLGAGLARVTLEVVLATLLRRLPDLRLDPGRPPRVRHQSAVFRGHHELPVLF